MEIILATWLFEPQQGDHLTDQQAWNRLLSYYHTMEKKDQFINYIKTGRNHESQKIRIVRNT